jgi:hypothetical protein
LANGPKRRLSAHWLCKNQGDCVKTRARDSEASQKAGSKPFLRETRKGEVSEKRSISESSRSSKPHKRFDRLRRLARNSSGVTAWRAVCRRAGDGRTRAAMSFVRLSRSNFFGLPPLRKSGVSFPIAHRRQCGVSGGAPLTSVFVIQKHCSLSPFTFSLGL